MLTSKNFQLIMEVVYDHFTKKYQIAIGENEEQLCTQIMKRNHGQYPNDTPRVFLKKCVSELMGRIDNGIKDQIKQESIEQRREQAVDYPNNLPGNNKDVSDRMKKMEQERAMGQQKTDRNPLQFQEKITTDNTKVSGSFEDAQRARQQEEQSRAQMINRQIGQPQPQLKAPEITQPDKPVPEQKVQTIQPVSENQAYESGPVPADSTEFNVGTIANKAPMSEGQHLLIEKSEAFKQLEGDSYKYNNNMLKSFTLIINSQDRNTSAYPSNSSYQIDLDVIYKDIISVELISAIVPKTQYLLNSSNSTIYFNEGGSEISATVSSGNYTATALGTALGNAMTTSGGQTYTVTPDSTTTNTYTISASGTFSLIFVGDTVTYNETTRTNYKTNSIGPVIGFSKTDFVTSTSHTGDNQFNLNGDTYVLLHIKDFDNLFGVHNESVSKSFAKIMLDTPQSEYKFFKSQTDYITRKEFSPMKAKLSQLNIKFLNYNGSEYDFGGLEHTLCFKITTLNQSQGYYF